MLTYAGKVAVATVTPRNGVETVYNLEVKDWHNFLVGDAGVVVHNNCMQVVLKGKTGAKGLIGEVYEDWLRDKIPGSRKVDNTELGPWQQREYDIYLEIDNKKILGEAKSGNALNLQAWERKIRSQLGQQNADAVANGYDFFLFSNTPIPDYVKAWCNNKNIQFVETLD